MKCKHKATCSQLLCVPEFCREFERAPETHGDRIRSMSDEELGRLLCKYRQTEDCCSHCPAGDICKGGKPGLIEWLGQPAEEE